MPRQALFLRLWSVPQALSRPAVVSQSPAGSNGFEFNPADIYYSSRSVAFLNSLSYRFPADGLSATRVCSDWLLDWSLAAKWGCPLITYLAAAYPTPKIEAR